jgi:hypothetical protein
MPTIGTKTAIGGRPRLKTTQTAVVKTGLKRSKSEPAISGKYNRFNQIS